MLSHGRIRSAANEISGSRQKGELNLSIPSQGLVFRALGEIQNTFRWCGKWMNKNENSSAMISFCQCPTLCFGGLSAVERLTRIIDFFPPEDGASENKQHVGDTAWLVLPQSPPPGPSRTSALWSAAPWRWSRPGLLGTSAKTWEEAMNRDSSAW